MVHYIEAIKAFLSSCWQKEPLLRIWEKFKTRCLLVLLVHSKRFPSLIWKFFFFLLWIKSFEFAHALIDKVLSKIWAINSLFRTLVKWLGSTQQSYSNKKWFFVWSIYLFCGGHNISVLGNTRQVSDFFKLGKKWSF